MLTMNFAFERGEENSIAQLIGLHQISLILHRVSHTVLSLHIIVIFLMPIIMII